MALVECSRCRGKGALSIKLGAPDSDPHKTYTGPWCVFPPHVCPVCHGSGTRNEKPNLVAGFRVRFDEYGLIASKEPLGET